MDPVKQNILLKIVWTNDVGKATLWAKNSYLDPIAQSTSTSSSFSLPTFPLTNNIALVPLNYTGGESFSFHSSLTKISGRYIILICISYTYIC